MFRKLLALLLATFSTGAQAGWSSATSRHFIVYTQSRADSAADLAAKLEKYFFVLKAVSGATGEDSPLKIRLYMVEDTRAVRKTLPFEGADGIAGYYNATTRGAFAVMPRSLAADGPSQGPGGLTPQQVLFHELAHHFMHQYFPAAYPTWYSEGFADFYGSMQIKPNDEVEIGAPIANRYLGFEGNNWFPIRNVLTAQSYADIGPNLSDLYSEGWLLVHYLSTTNARPGQLAKYLKAINGGQSFATAANNAFGDLDKLNSELYTYAHRERLQLLVLPFKKIDAGPVETRALSAAEDAMVPFEISLSSGVAQQEVNGFADRVAAAAAHYSNDPTALADLFDAQRLAGRTADASRTADRWAMVAPNDGMAIAAQGMIRSDMLVAAHSTDIKAWTDVRRSLAKANTLTPDRPRILRAYYETYRRQGIGAPDTAQPVLYRAFRILPQDDELRTEVASDFESRGMTADAIQIIKPLAYNLGEAAATSPKDQAKRDAQKAKYKIAGQDPDGETARAMLKRLEAKEKDQKPAS